MTIDAPSRDQLPALKRLWRQCFGDSRAEIGDFFRTGFSPERSRCVTVDGNVAAALYWLDAYHRGRKLAYVYAVGTAPALRGRGLCHALLEDTHRRLASDGYSGAVVVPAEPVLFSLYEKLGYRAFGGVCEFTAQASGEPAALRPIEAAEYAALRRQMLGPEGVIQEGPTLAYLQTMASFYAGDGLLLAASRVGDFLAVRELLGDPLAAGGILTALGAARGRFRTPGKAPFAMYRSLDGEAAPAYFGLALD